jgi:pimeloyl-ACP methyl ester carboxylesterase
MLLKILLSIGALLVVVTVIIFFSYQIWRSQHYDLLNFGGEFIETEAGTIQYVLQGTEGPHLLFLHGTPGGYDQAYGENPDFITLTPSRPGYLGTPLNVGRTPAEQAESYIALMDKLDIKSVVVVGASGGGPSAISFSAIYPERTMALIAIEAVSKSEEIQALPAFLSSDFLVWLAFSVTNLLPDKTVMKMMIPDPANRQLAQEDPKKIAAIRALSWSLWPPSLRSPGMDNDLAQFSNLSLPIDKISVPTLVIHGSADTNVDFSHGELLAATIPNAKFHVIEGGDHMMPFTHEEEVQGVIAEFIESVIVGVN